MNYHTTRTSPQSTQMPCNMTFEFTQAASALSQTCVVEASIPTPPFPDLRLWKQPLMCHYLSAVREGRGWNVTHHSKDTKACPAPAIAEMCEGGGGGGGGRGRRKQLLKSRLQPPAASSPNRSRVLMSCQPRRGEAGALKKAVLL